LAFGTNIPDRTAGHQKPLNFPFNTTRASTLSKKTTDIGVEINKKNDKTPLNLWIVNCSYEKYQIFKNNFC